MLSFLFMITLSPLPFEKNALEPIIWEKTIELHYGKHHNGYVVNLNNLIKDTEFEKMSLEEIIKKTKNKPEHKAIYNNAAQVWNHDFFWKSLTPSIKNSDILVPEVELNNLSMKGLELIKKSFGDVEAFKTKLHDATVKQFGAGWGWVVFNKTTKLLEIASTSNADTPLTDENLIPILTIDVWEHSYYLDYQNRRIDYEIGRAHV